MGNINTDNNDIMVGFELQLEQYMYGLEDYGPNDELVNISFNGEKIWGLYPDNVMPEAYDKIKENFSIEDCGDGHLMLREVEFKSTPKSNVDKEFFYGVKAFITFLLDSSSNDKNKVIEKEIKEKTSYYKITLFPFNYNYKYEEKNYTFKSDKKITFYWSVDDKEAVIKPQMSVSFDNPKFLSSLVRECSRVLPEEWFSNNLDDGKNTLVSKGAFNNFTIYFKEDDQDKLKFFFYKVELLRANFLFGIWRLKFGPKAVGKFSFGIMHRKPLREMLNIYNDYFSQGLNWDNVNQIAKYIDSTVNLPKEIKYKEANTPININLESMIPYYPFLYMPENDFQEGEESSLIRKYSTAFGSNVSTEGFRGSGFKNYIASVVCNSDMEIGNNAEWWENLLYKIYEKPTERKRDLFSPPPYEPIHISHIANNKPQCNKTFFFEWRAMPLAYRTDKKERASLSDDCIKWMVNKAKSIIVDVGLEEGYRSGELV